MVGLTSGTGPNQGANPLPFSYRPYEVVTDEGSQGKLVSERSRPGSARSAFQAAQAASTTAS